MLLSLAENDFCIQWDEDVKISKVDCLWPTTFSKDLNIDYIKEDPFKYA